MVTARSIELHCVLIMLSLSIYYVSLTLPVLITTTKFLKHHLTIPKLVHLFFFLGLSQLEVPTVLFQNPLWGNSIGKVNSRLPEYLQLKNPTGHTARRSMITIAVNAKVDPVFVALATKHKDPKSFLGYIEAAPQSVMAAGLAVAAAAKSNHRRSRFVAGIDLDLPSEYFGVDSSSSSSSSCLAVCLPVSNVQENIVVSDLAPVVASTSSTPKSGNVYNFHFN